VVFGGGLGLVSDSRPTPPPTPTPTPTPTPRFTIYKDLLYYKILVLIIKSYIEQNTYKNYKSTKQDLNNNQFDGFKLRVRLLI